MRIYKVKSFCLGTSLYLMQTSQKSVLQAACYLRFLIMRSPIDLSIAGNERQHFMNHESRKAVIKNFKGLVRVCSKSALELKYKP